MRNAFNAVQRFSRGKNVKEHTKCFQSQLTKRCNCLCVIRASTCLFVFRLFVLLGSKENMRFAEIKKKRQKGLFVKNEKKVCFKFFRFHSFSTKSKLVKL